MRSALKRLLRLCLLSSCFWLCSIPVPAQQKAIPVPTSSDTIQLQKLIDDISSKGKTLSDTGIRVLTRALQQCIRLNYREGIASSHYSMAHIYYDMGSYEEANEHFIASIPYWPQNSEGVTSLFNACFQAASTARILEKLNDAAGYFYKALDIAAKNPGIPLRVDKVYINLGTVFMDNGKQMDEALYYFDKGEALIRQKKDSSILGIILFNKALCWYCMAEKSEKPHATDSSRALFREALALGNQIKDSVLQYRALTRLTLPLLCPNNDTAIAYIAKAEKIRAQGDAMPFMKIVALRIIGDVYLRAGKHKQAIASYEHAVKLSNKYTVPVGPVLCLSMAKAYAGEGLYRKAYEYHTLYTQQQDSVQNEKVRTSVSEMDIRYKAAEKDRDIAQKKLLIASQQRNLSRKSMWLAISVAAGLLLFTISMGMYRNVRHKQYLQKQQIKMLEKQKEIELLKGMIRGEEKERTRMARELHDGIGGMLTTVNLSLNKVKKKQELEESATGIGEVQQMIGDVAAEVRKTAHNLMPDILVMHRLEDALLQYCASINAAGELQVEIITSGELSILEKSAELLLYRITQELIQNVIKHARARLAVVQIIVHEGEISLSVEDNGMGFDVEAKTGSGYGLQNLQHRIEVLQGNLSVHSELGKGTTTYLHFNLEKLETVF